MPADEPTPSPRDNPPSRPSWFAVLTAPLVAPFAPTRAGMIMSQARIPWLVLSVFLCIELAWATGNFVKVWDGTLAIDWADEVLAPIQWVPSTIIFPSGATTTTTPGEGEFGVIRRSFSESCVHSAAFRIDSWHLVYVLFFLFKTLLLSVPLAFVFIPDAHCSGLIRHTFLRNLNVVWILSFVAFAGPLLIRGYDAVRQHAHLLRFVRGELGPNAPIWFDDFLNVGPWHPFALCMLIVAGSWWSWTVGARMARGANAIGATCLIPVPRCRSCGYSLVHVPDSLRCPECGSQLEESINAGFKEMIPWQRIHVGRASAFVETTRLLIRSPRQTYSSLRTLGRSRVGTHFMIVHLLLLFSATLLLVLFGRVNDLYWTGYSLRYGLFDEVFIPVFGALVGGWVLYRAVAATALSWVALQRNRPGTQAMIAVIPYEVIGLWMFFSLNGALFVADIFLQGWMIDLGEVFEFLSGRLSLSLSGFVGICNTILVAVWALRFRAAWRAVRYANF